VEFHRSSNLTQWCTRCAHLCSCACPGKSEWAARSARDVNGVQSLLGFGWRVNFAGEGDRVNVSLMKAGTFGDHFCFSVLKDITPTEELLFAPDFHYRSALVSVVNGSV